LGTNEAGGIDAVPGGLKVELLLFDKVLCAQIIYKNETADRIWSSTTDTRVSIFQGFDEQE
jgi:hypothetical protein